MQTAYHNFRETFGAPSLRTISISSCLDLVERENPVVGVASTAGCVRPPDSIHGRALKASRLL